MQVFLIFTLLAVFILFGFSIAFALGLTSLGFILLATNVPLTIVVQRLFVGVDSFTYLSVPLFMFAGILMGYTRIADLIVDHCVALVGHFKGGLAAVNIVTSVFFAGISGSAMADTAAVGGVLIPAMKEKGYSAEFTGAITASSSTIGIIIPPSTPMILYAVYVGHLSVTTLFISGIIPGIVIGLFLLVISTIISYKRNYGSEGKFSLKNYFLTLYKGIPALFLPVIILGGIMGGIFTATEAAGVAVLYVIIIGFVYRDLTFKKLVSAAKDACLMTGSTMIIISIASLLGWVFAYAKIPQMLVQPILSLTTNKYVFMWLASLILIVAGTFLHGTGLLVIIVPLFLPIVATLGIHPLHFAMVVIMCWGLGQQTPPVGSSLYITCTIAEIDMWALTKANLPFVGALVAVLALIIHFPNLMVFPLPKWLGLM